MYSRIQPDYIRDSQIDLDQLEKEWTQHPEIEEAYIDQVRVKKQEWIEAVESEKLAHEKVKTKRSKLIQFCHENSERCIGKSKATGPEVEAYYRTHPDYLKIKKRHNNAQIAVLEAEAEYETAKDMKDLIHFTKTKALEQLVLLHGQGYFAGPTAPRKVNMQEFRQDMQAKKRSAAIKVSRNR